MKGRVAEIFESIQGEGLYFGEKQLFIRFFGCNLECVFCDTKQEQFTEYQPNDLLKKLDSYRGDYHSVAFTGGEPLMQKEFLKRILRFTSSQGQINYLETNGTLYRELEDVIKYVDIVAMDLKLPSSTLSWGCWKAHTKFLEIASKKDTFIKCVITQSTTAADIKRVAALIKEINHYPVVVLQPNSFEQSLQVKQKIKKFRKILENDGITCCAIPQLHKIWEVR